MKKRGGFDSGKIKRFFILHMEKMALALVGLCFLMFVYNAATQESFTGKTPEQITQEAASARDYVEKSAWVPTLVTVDENDLDEKVKLSRTPIPGQPFKLV